MHNSTCKYNSLLIFLRVHHHLDEEPTLNADVRSPEGAGTSLLPSWEYAYLGLGPTASKVSRTPVMKGMECAWLEVLTPSRVSFKLRILLCPSPELPMILPHSYIKHAKLGVKCRISSFFPHLSKQLSVVVVLMMHKCN